MTKRPGQVAGPLVLSLFWCLAFLVPEKDVGVRVVLLRILDHIDKEVCRQVRGVEVERQILALGRFADLCIGGTDREVVAQDDKVRSIVRGFFQIRHDRDVGIDTDRFDPAFVMILIFGGVTDSSHF